jgi:hypothetical protein
MPLVYYKGEFITAKCCSNALIDLVPQIFLIIALATIVLKAFNIFLFIRRNCILLSKEVKR